MVYLLWARKGKLIDNALIVKHTSRKKLVEIRKRDKRLKHAHIYETEPPYNVGKGKMGRVYKVGTLRKLDFENVKQKDEVGEILNEEY